VEEEKKEQRKESKATTKVVMVRRKTDKGKRLVFNTNEPSYNFMKHWRIIKYWAKKKYDISEPELEVVFFLYDEGLFTRHQFRNFTSLLSWDKDRLNKFIEKGLVILWRNHKGYRQRGKLYTLSPTAKRMCNSIYKKLMGEEKIPENSTNNPVFKGNNSTDKIYRRLIKEMNQRFK